jgi:hypothetical protein
MLPQSAALGVSSEHRGKVKPRTREIRAVSQHDRGERPALSAGPSPAKRPETPAEQSGVTRVFVLGKDGAHLMPCHAARARELLAKGKAVVAVLRIRVAADAQRYRDLRANARVYPIGLREL